MKQCCLCGKSGHDAQECKWNNIPGTCSRWGYQPRKMPDGYVPNPPPRKP